MLLWRLLRKNIVAGQLIGYMAATLLGLSIVLLSLQFYNDIKPAFSAQEGVFGRDFLVISKKVSILKTLGLSSSKFSDDEMKELRSQSFVKRISGFTASSFKVFASTQISGKTTDFSSLLFFESVPDEFLEIDSNDWQWQPGSNQIPIIIPRSYLALYNFGFAPSQSLPQLSEKTVGLLDINIEISGVTKSATFHSRIVGFTDRINSILVPQKFMKWANTEYGAGNAAPSRVIIEPHNLSDPAINNYFINHHYEIANDKAVAGQVSAFLRTLIIIVMGIGTIITLLALGLMLLSINLLIQKNHTKIENLSLMGFATHTIARPYQGLVILLNGVILVLAVGIVTYLRGFYADSFSNSMQLEESGFAWSYVLWGFYLILALSLINITWIFFKIKEIRK